MMPEPEEREVAVRAYQVPRPANSGSRKGAKEVPPSRYTLTFDTETFTDAAMQLRLGAYQVHEGDVLYEAGLFYDPESLDRDELRLVHEYARAHDLTLLTCTEFVEEVFFPVLVDLRGTCIGFNLPFDISRLAIRHARARGNMRGGFSFALSEDERRPHVQVRHLNRHTSLIRFAAPGKQRMGRGMRRRGLYVPPERGFFVDVHTLACALLGGSWRLSTLTEHLDTRTKKDESKQHGERLTEEYLDYAVSDVQATWECYVELRKRYAKLGLTRTPLHRIYSEASLGKANLREMGVRPWRELQKAFPPEVLGKIIATYYGGRSEVGIRREMVRILYCDFLSEYPTVCTLMGLWRFVRAKGVRKREATSWARRFLDKVTLEDLQKPETWRALTVLVRVRPHADLFPVRSKYDGVQYTIGLNYLTAEDGEWWFTLADCIACKLLTGRSPEVLEALRFESLGVQDDLRPVDLFGDERYRVEPATADFYKRVIELRRDVKVEQRAARAAGDVVKAERLDAQEKQLKIVANSTSYGVFMELNSEQVSKARPLEYFGPDGAGESEPSSTFEQPGVYFHPLLATLITGAGRLLLAIAERLGADQGLDWAFCDTDSMALAQPAEMDDEEFVRHAIEVQEWFGPLNPYEGGGELFKLEDVNFALDETGKVSNRLDRLYCLAISAKRYVLFNLVDERIVIRKASAHGLGHLMAPYADGKAPATIPAPVVQLHDIGVERWQHDLWYRIIEAHVAGHADEVELDDLPGFHHAAFARYAATTPELLAWYRRYNRERPYREQVRPFNFHLAGQLRWVPPVPGDDERRRETRPAAPFDKNVAVAAGQAFDRTTGNPVPGDELAAYVEVLRQYHLHPESKFEHADFTERGRTQRRHSKAIGIRYIGKEANRWEEQYFVGADPDASVHYGDEGRTDLDEAHCLRRELSSRSASAVARAAGISEKTVRAFRKGNRVPSPQTLAALRQARAELYDEAALATKVIANARRSVSAEGLRPFARRVGLSPGHLSQLLSGQRSATLASVQRLVGRTPESPLDKDS